MNRVSKLFALVFIIILMQACGSKRSPTGGPVDKTSPELLSSLPSEFSDITDQVIELTFSKDLDKSSITTGLYIYPPVLNKNVLVEKNRVLISLNEELLPNTNYYVSLTPRIKDLRGNSLAEATYLVYASGELQRNRLSGILNYEKEEDRGRAMQFSLYSSDSLQVLSRQIRTGAFALDEINQGDYFYRAFIDKNENSRYDFGTEPWAESTVSVRGVSSIEINLAYADTSKVRLRSIVPVSNRELQLVFTEELASYSSISISDSSGMALPIQITHHTRDKINLITNLQNPVTYKLSISNLRDLKGNLTPISQFSFKGSTLEDKTAPRILSSIPRNGTSVNSQRPNLQVVFSEIIPADSLSFRLISPDDDSTIPVQKLQAPANQLLLRPEADLRPNRSYILIIEDHTADSSGNRLAEAYRLNFLVLLPS